MQMMSGWTGGTGASSGCSSNGSCASQDVDAQQQQQQQQHMAAVRSVAGLTSTTQNVMTLTSPLHQHLSVKWDLKYQNDNKIITKFKFFGWV